MLVTSRIALRCPVEKSRLDAHFSEGVRFSACRRCSGVWLDRETLRQQTARPLPRPRDQRRGGTVVTTAARDRDCPQCTRRLTLVRVAGVEIDRCDTCGGLWLDAGEYDAIRNQLGAVRGGAGADAFGPAENLRGYVVEAGEVGLRAVLELLADVLS